MDSFNLDPLGTCTETDANYFQPNLNFNLSILNINIQSIVSNSPGLQAFLNQIKITPSLIIVTETWLDDKMTSLFTLPGCSVRWRPS